MARQCHKFVSQIAGFFASTCWYKRMIQSNGVLAQLVERLNGIEEVRGSSPLGSRIPTFVGIS
jgi:hypothetical protein